MELGYKGDAGAWDPEVTYEGSGEALAEDLADLVHGGQVVLSESAWRAVQDHIPGQAQVRAPAGRPPGSMHCFV
jgi:class 3 adenylate cyclase